MVSKAPSSRAGEGAARLTLKLAKRARRCSASENDDRYCWAELLKRVFSVDGWQCPCCGKPMKLRALVVREEGALKGVRGLLRA